MPHVSETTIEAASGRRARWAALHDVIAWRWFPHAVLFGLGFLIRLVWVVAVDRDGFAFNDSIMYHTTAMSISDGNGYVPLTGGPTARWPPGYSTVLGGLYWLFGQEPLAGELFNAVVGALTIVLLMLVVERTIDRGAAVVAGTMLAVLPGPILWTDVLVAETLYTALFVAMVLVVVSSRADLAVVHRHRRGRRTRSPRARRSADLAAVAGRDVVAAGAMASAGPGHGDRRDRRRRRAGAVDDPERGGDGRLRARGDECQPDTLVGSQRRRHRRSGVSTRRLRGPLRAVAARAGAAVFEGIAQRRDRVHVHPPGA